MAATRQSVSIWAGDSLNIRIALTDSDGAALALDGSATARWWAGTSATATGADILVQKSTGGGGITIETAAGQSTLVVALDLADTVDVTPGNHYHEAEIINLGATSTVTTGRFAVIAALITPEA